jgi:molecular chaperone GrpE
MNSESNLNAVNPSPSQPNGSQSEEPVPVQGDADSLPAEPTGDQLIALLQAELEEERSRYNDLYDRFQRTAAEYQNSRRRMEKQMHDSVERASTHVIKRILPVVDDLDLALQSASANLDTEQSAWLDGFRQIHKKLLALLEDEGVLPIDTSGEFDPGRHEAIGSEATDSVPSGHIATTLRTGYEQRGHVLRPALVRVAH